MAAAVVVRGVADGLAAEPSRSSRLARGAGTPAGERGLRRPSLQVLLDPMTTRLHSRERERCDRASRFGGANQPHGDSLNDQKRKGTYPAVVKSKYGYSNSIWR